MKRFLLVSILIGIFLFKGFSQIPPDNGILYDDTEIVKIKIEIDPDSLSEMLEYENLTSDHEYPARFIFIHSGEIDTVETIGFRLRGNTSRYSSKKSFKVSFNTFYGGRKFKGVEKLNLNGEHNDPSIVRTKLSFDLYKKAGLPAPRTAHVELYINNEYRGLYINVEHIDEEFAESRFGNKNGNLFKCLYPATMEIIGDGNPNDYKFMSGDHRAYELITNNEADDYTDLANFINILNSTPSGDLATELEPIFNVNSYLKHLALEVLTGHWDGYSYNKNNFYLYHNTLTGKFEFIPYDLDNTFGIDWFGIDWAIRNIYTWAASEPRPLTSRLLQNQVYRDRFSFYMNELLEEHFNSTVFFPEIDAIKAMITLAATNDVYRTYDYGWNMVDFNNSYTTFNNQHVKYGIKDYITTRHNNAVGQLDVNPVSPMIRNITFYKLFPGRDFEVFAYVEDEDPTPEVLLHYSINSASVVNVDMNDDGTGNDLYPGDRVYSALVTAPLNGPGIFEFNLSAGDDQANTSYEPLTGMYLLGIPENSDSELTINEVMAANSSRVHDEYGDYDDWVEIYNGGTTSVWLGNKYLSDDYLTPDKWQMPDMELHSGEFKLFWCDGETWEGLNHTGFKLNADGEEIGIFDSEVNAFAQIDFVEFGIQQSNISIGRIPNGTGPIAVLPYATPEYSNTTPLIVPFTNESSIEVYPNPMTDGIFVKTGVSFQGDFTVSMYSITGRLVSEYRFSGQSDIIYLSREELKAVSGIYLLNVTCPGIGVNNNRVIVVR
jgi:hypothetical protein